MPYQKSSEARRDAGSGVCGYDILSGLRAAGVQELSLGPIDRSLQEHGRPAGGASDASSGSGGGARRVRIQTASCPDRTGRMARESQAHLSVVPGGRIGHEKEASQAAQGLCEEGASASGRGKERVLEHGFHVG